MDEEKGVKQEPAANTSQASQVVKPNGLALVPFLVFVIVYLGSGIILDMSGMEMAFYQFPAPLAAAIGAIAAFILIRGSFEEKFETFVRGCGDSNIIIMCVIYLLAGGFAATCKAMGGIDSTGNLGLTYIPPELLADPGPGHRDGHPVDFLWRFGNGSQHRGTSLYAG